MCLLTKDKIKQKALTLFVQRGYNGTSLSDIGKEVGIKKQSIYTHFKSKDDLFIQVMHRVLREEDNAINKYFEGAQHQYVFDILYGLIELFQSRFMHEQEENVKFLLRMMFIPPIHIKETVIQEVLNFYRNIEKNVEKVLIENESALKVEPLKAKLAFMNLFDGLLVEIVYVSVESFEKRLSASWDVFVNGVKK